MPERERAQLPRPVHIPWPLLVWQAARWHVPRESPAHMSGSASATERAFWIRPDPSARRLIRPELPDASRGRRIYLLLHSPPRSAATARVCIFLLLLLLLLLLLRLRKSPRRVIRREIPRSGGSSRCSARTARWYVNCRKMRKSHGIIRFGRGPSRDLRATPRSSTPSPLPPPPQQRAVRQITQ